MKCSLLVLSSYLDGELEARREGELEAHLVGCQRCRAGLGYLREEVERVSALGRVHVAEHSTHELLAQLGLIAEDEPAPHYHAAVALAEPPPSAWMGADDATNLPWDAATPAVDELPPDEPDVVMTGSPDPTAYAPPADVEPAEAPIPVAPAEPDAPERPWFRWVPEQPEEAAPEAETPAPPIEPAASTVSPPGAPGAPVPFTWSPSAGDRPGSSPPTPIEHGPPPAASLSDTAPPAPTGGAFPPGGPERTEPSDPPTQDSSARSRALSGGLPPRQQSPAFPPAPGGEPEMTASPPWTPHEAPAGPLYPMTDDDVLGEPLPVERFGPPAPAPRPSLFERLRDRLATRRALSRSSSAYDDQVQIVSGLGAPLRTGRARLEVERRRQEALRVEHDAAHGSARPLYDAAHADAAASRFDADADLHCDPHGDAEAGDMDDDGLADLGPLPPLPQQVGPMPRPVVDNPRPPATPMPPVAPGQMALPGTSVDNPLRTDVSDWRAPIHRTPMPPPRHTIGSAIGELPPSQRPPLPPGQPVPPVPPAAPPPTPTPDPLGEALSDFDRDRDRDRGVTGGTTYEPRPWRPREIAEDLTPPRTAPAPPDAADRRAPSPSQLRDGRRLLAIFGAATLLMLVVGMVSGRTVSPLPASNSTSSTQHTQQPQAKASQPPARASQAPANPVAPLNLTPSQAPAAGAPALTGTKVVGDGGTGYQVKDFRYGIHPGDFRIVLDYSPAGTATGTPKATVGFLDQQTIDVVLDGVVPAGSTGDLPSTNPVTSVSLQQPSPFPGSTTYQIKLAHPATFTVGYVNTGGVLKLVIDIAG